MGYLLLILSSNRKYLKFDKQKNFPVTKNFRTFFKKKKVNKMYKLDYLRLQIIIFMYPNKVMLSSNHL